MSKSIYDISSEIDEKFVDEAENYSAKAFPKKKLFKYGSLCASLVIVIISAILIFPAIFAPEAEDSSKNIEYVGQGSDSKPWDERPSYEKFPKLIFNEVSYSASGKTIAFDKLGEIIKEDVIFGYDEENDKAYNEDIKIYSILGIGPDKAIAIKIDGDGEYYIYSTSGYISGAIEKFDLTTPDKSEIEF